MIWALIHKDFLRVRRNYIGVLILLSMPLGITGMVGLLFGPSSGSSSMPQIKMAVVDEDESVLGGLLRNIAGRSEADNKLDLRFLEKEAALALLNDNEISAVLIIPPGFTQDYLRNSGPISLELIKNPAQSFMPAIIEEMLGVAVESLNAVAVNFGEELSGAVEVFESDQAPSTARLVSWIKGMGEKFERAEDVLFPPVLALKSESQQQKNETDAPTEFDIFAYLLPGMASMFLLFIADSVVQDIYKENRGKTLDRYRTMRAGILPFLVSKCIYTGSVTALASGILFGIGGAAFGIDWKSPWPLAALAVCFCVFATGFVSFVAGLVGNEKRAAMFNGVLIMLIAFLGGSIMPMEQMPRFIKYYAAPAMPNHWFHMAIHKMQFGWEGPHWLSACAALVCAGIVFIALAVWLFNRGLLKG